ncbi:hypothetical protein [uncultured Ruegeria sp.]|uniref:hypothetical protein n=1 Tax=uncultured Ruegeria sp. TaxID=259304 RepID=UPI002605BACD|nr:hypothetical protein [uncultured Ruegeria sp.]
MPLMTVLNRVFAAKMPDTPNNKETSVPTSDPFVGKRSISKAETAAVLRGIMKDEQMKYPKQHTGGDSAR